MPFKPGYSGNPSGRPKITLADGRTLAEVAREHTEAAIEALAEIATNKQESASARVSAATALLDRGWGKPKQTVVGDVNEDPVQVMQRLVTTPIRQLNPEDAFRVMDFFYGSDFIDEALAVQPARYIEHQPEIKN